MGFHLNHVGYKALAYNAVIDSGNAFHLNHVGYKACLAIPIIAFLPTFHLNHVGYKENCSETPKGGARNLSSEPCGI